MGLEFLSRVRRTSIVTSLVIALFLAAYLGTGDALGWLIGCAWSLANLHVIQLLVGSIAVEGRKRRMRVALLLLVKVPLLYGVGFVALKTDLLPAAALLSGFAWPFAVASLKSLGRMLLGMDRGARTRSGGIRSAARRWS